MNLPIREEHRRYLGHQLTELQGKVKTATMRKLQLYETQARAEYGLSAIDALFLLHHDSKSLAELAQLVQIPAKTFYRVFVSLGLPTLSQKEANRRRLNASRE